MLLPFFIDGPLDLGKVRHCALSLTRKKFRHDDDDDDETVRGPKMEYIHIYITPRRCDLPLVVE